MPSARTQSVVAVAGVALFLVLGFGLFGSTGHDDSHITYWVAHALEKTGRLVNYNGARVEQSSSLAQVVLLATLAAVTRLDIPTLGPVTSIGFGVAAIVLTGRLTRRLAPEAPPLAELVTASFASFVYWGFGGLETTLFAASALWLILAWDGYLAEPGRRPVHAALATLVFLAARPEAPLVLGCACVLMLGYAWRWRQGRERVYVAIGVCAAQAAALFAFRRLYFGALFPNPVYTKATRIEVERGLAYLWAQLGPPGLWLLGAAVLGVCVAAVDALRAGGRPAASLTVGVALGYAGFVVLTGGDWMTGGRFVAHFAPLLAVLAVVGVARVLRGRRWATAAVCAGVASNLWGTLALANGNSTGRPLWSTGRLREQVDARVGPRGYSWFELANKVHLRDATVSAEMVDLVGALRRKHPDRKLTLMASQAGMVVYHAFAAHPQALHFVDMCSLATRDFVTCLPPSELDRRQVGLQLHFDRYFRRREAIDAQCGTRRPDVVFALGHRGIEAVLTRNGYVIVYSQRGPITNQGLGEKWLRSQLGSDEFIAVDRELFEGVDYPVKPPFVWNIR